MFLDTLFYYIFYVDNGTCENYTKASQCLENLNIATTESKCSWDHQSNQCSFRSPPNSIVLIVTVSFITSILILPIDLILSNVLYEYCLVVESVYG